MRAVTKLERRFNRALTNLETDANAGSDADEIARLSNQISILEAAQSEKDAKINKLSAEAGTASEKSKTEEAAVQKQVSDLESKLKDALAASAITDEQSSKSADLDAEIVDLKAEIEEANANAENLTDRVRSLRGSLRQMRIGLKDNIVNADDINAAMQSELEALQAQREVDLNEVNTVLEKLVPLVEVK